MHDAAYDLLRPLTAHRPSPTHSLSWVVDRPLTVRLLLLVGRPGAAY